LTATASLATRIALRKARASERTWATTATPSIPSSGARPNSRQLRLLVGGDVVVVGVFLYKTSPPTLNGADILRLSPAGKQLA